MTTPNRIRVSDIAQRAEVSPATVSKVINGRGDVALATRSRVEQVMADMGFSKPLVRTKTQQTVELVLTHMENNGTIALTRAATQLGETMGFGLTLSQSKGGRAHDVYRSVIDRNPLGVILLLNKMPSRDSRLLSSRNIPYVIIDPVTDVPPDVFSVGIDNWTAGFDATKHLIDLGHRRIGVITGSKDARSSIGRYAGYTTALETAGIPLDPALTADGDYLSQSGYEAALALLNLPEDRRPTAIFAFNDLTAVSVYRAAYEKGLRIPDDLSVVGFDNVYPASYLAPGLTTVNQPFDLMAKNAVDLIIAARNGTVEQTHIVLPTRLVVRGSTGAPKVSA